MSAPIATIGLTATAIAVLVGAIAGPGTFGLLLATQDDSFAIGAFIYGALAAGVGFGTAYAATVLVATFRWRPAGHRFAAIASLLCVPFGLVGLALFAYVSRSTSERNAERNELLEAHGGLVLVDGNALDDPFPKWELRSVSVHPDPAGVSVDWTIGESALVASLKMGESGTIQRCSYCREVGRRTDGAAILAGHSLYVTSIGSTEYTLRVHGAHDTREAVELLRRIQAVDAAAFRRACERRC